MRRRAAGSEAAPSSEARPTPLPKVNFTLLGLGPSASRTSFPAPPPLPRARQQAHEAEQLVPSDAELDALLRRVDPSLEQTIEVDARPVRPPWQRRRRRRTIWAGLVLYLAVGSASFLWLAGRSKRAAPAAEQTIPETDLPATAPVEAMLGASMSGAGAQPVEPAARAVSAAAPRKPERRVVAAKKAKRAKLMAARARRRKRAGRAGQTL